MPCRQKRRPASGAAARVRQHGVAEPQVVLEDVQIDGLQIAGQRPELDVPENAAKRIATGTRSRAPGIAKPQRLASRQERRGPVDAGADVAAFVRAEDGIGNLGAAAADAVCARLHDEQDRHAVCAKPDRRLDRGAGRRRRRASARVLPRHAASAQAACGPRACRTARPRPEPALPVAADSPVRRRRPPASPAAVLVALREARWLQQEGRAPPVRAKAPLRVRLPECRPARARGPQTPSLRVAGRLQTGGVVRGAGGRRCVLLLGLATCLRGKAGLAQLPHPVQLLGQPPGLLGALTRQLLLVGRVRALGLRGGLRLAPARAAGVSASPASSSSAFARSFSACSMRRRASSVSRASSCAGPHLIGFAARAGEHVGLVRPALLHSAARILCRFGCRPPLGLGGLARGLRLLLGLAACGPPPPCALLRAWRPHRQARPSDFLVSAALGLSAFFLAFGAVGLAGELLGHLVRGVVGPRRHSKHQRSGDQTIAPRATALADIAYS